MHKVLAGEVKCADVHMHNMQSTHNLCDVVSAVQDAVDTCSLSVVANGALMTPQSVFCWSRLIHKWLYTTPVLPHT